MRNTITLWLLEWVISRVHRDDFKGYPNYDIEVKALARLKDALELLRIRDDDF